MSSRASEFSYLCELVKTSTAISLDSQREYLMEARLGTVAQREGFASVSELLNRVRAGGSTQLQWKVVEAMTTNETSFFRDIKPFEALRQVVIPTLMKARQAERKLSIWCAACSSGQEPYTIAMMLREHFSELQNWKVTILATDIASDMLDKSKGGRYTQLEVNRGLPANYLIKYFKKDGVDWQIDESIRKMVEIRRMNLSVAWPLMPPIDLVMLRNVMIYFPVETKKQILKNMRSVLRPDGYLFLGTAETTINLDVNFACESFKNVSYYRPGTK
ncbi:MAG TPA: protein-glutamate O-methyltransferase CheR [Candidatus Angelobacter sp.]|jgi:chemotaxis protein methyltransferase CheR|nr:protein-glutamate O-methyltransferase CheR [Candidatus Angelobacter sp.]